MHFAVDGNTLIGSDFFDGFSHLGVLVQSQRSVGIGNIDVGISIGIGACTYILVLDDTYW